MMTTRLTLRGGWNREATDSDSSARSNQGTLRSSNGKKRTVKKAPSNANTTARTARARFQNKTAFGRSKSMHSLRTATPVKKKKKTKLGAAVNRVRSMVKSTSALQKARRAAEPEEFPEDLDQKYVIKPNSGVSRRARSLTRRGSISSDRTSQGSSNNTRTRRSSVPLTHDINNNRVPELDLPSPVSSTDGLPLNGSSSLSPVISKPSPLPSSRGIEMSRILDRKTMEEVLALTADEIMALQSLEIVEEIDCSNMDSLNDNKLRRILKRCKEIQKLNLSACRNISAAILAKLGRCTKLTHLSLSGCEQFFHEEIYDLLEEAVWTDRVSIDLVNTNFRLTRLANEEYGHLAEKFQGRLRLHQTTLI